MNIPLIFAWIWAAFIAMAFWESSVEGRNAWDRKKLGWKIKLPFYTMTRYSFFSSFVMFPMLLTLPLIIYGWNLKLFGIIVSAYFSGAVIEDFMWFIVNPVVSLKELNSKFANYYPWIKLGKFEIPAYYVTNLVLAFLSWLFIWR